MNWLTPVTAPAVDPAPDRPAQNLLDARRHLRSYHVMRTAIGVIGLALPVVLLVGDALLLAGDALPRGSLSAYYHSGMRDVFVGALCATAIFLVTYKVAEVNLDNTLSTAAGVAVLGVAVFPTERPPLPDVELTPLQVALGEGVVGTVHAVCAAVFILSLAVISYFFGERSSPPWRGVHRTAAVVIAVAVAAMLLSLGTGVLAAYSVLVGETVVLLAFGGSWLARGLQWGRLTANEVRPDVTLPRA